MVAKLGLIFGFLFTAQAFGNPVSDLVEQLRDSGEKYEVIGTICEQAAKLDMAREYPAPRYHVETGISYGSKERTVGELDVVVFDSDNSAVFIGEVKCWKSFSGALRKAREQRKRFQSAIASGSKLSFWHSEDSGHQQSAFEGRSTFQAISQKGGQGSGFERELSFSLEELMDAREQLMACQKSGKCRSARR